MTFTIFAILRHQKLFKSSNISYNHNIDKLKILTQTRERTERSEYPDSSKQKEKKMNPVVERSPCIFCNIVNKYENTEILYEDEDVCVFSDIKPASDYHVLTVPKRHIEDAKCLTKSDEELVHKMLAVSKELLQRNNLSVDDARFGYHWPPFRSVKHLHLHTIAPESKMGFISRAVFKTNSYWFVSPEYVTAHLR